MVNINFQKIEELVDKTVLAIRNSSREQNRRSIDSSLREFVAFWNSEEAVEYKRRVWAKLYDPESPLTPEERKEIKESYVNFEDGARMLVFAGAVDNYPLYNLASYLDRVRKYCERGQAELESIVKEGRQT